MSATWWQVIARWTESRARPASAVASASNCSIRPPWCDAMISMAAALARQSSPARLQQLGRRVETCAHRAHGDVAIKLERGRREVEVHEQADRHADHPRAHFELVMDSRAARRAEMLA